MWLLAGLMALMLVLASSAYGAAQEMVRDIPVSLRDFQFDPDPIELTAGETVRFMLRNDDSVPHTFTLVRSAADQDEPLADVSLPPGTQAEETFTVPTELSSLYLYCQPHASSMFAAVIIHAAQEPVEEEPAEEEPAEEEPAEEEPVGEEPAEEEPAEEETVEEEPPADEPAVEETPEDVPGEEEPAAEEPAAEEPAEEEMVDDDPAEDEAADESLADERAGAAMMLAWLAGAVVIVLVGLWLLRRRFA